MLLPLLVGTVVFRYTLYKLEKEHEHLNDNITYKNVKYRTIGTILWPWVFYYVVSKDNKDNMLLLPFVWPLAMWLLDCYFAIKFFDKDNSNKIHPSSYRIDPTTLSSMLFSMYGFLGCHKNSKYSYIFLYAILLCFVFVYPHYDLPENSNEDIIFKNVKKIMISWCIALMFSAVLLEQKSSLDIHKGVQEKNESKSELLS